jgi:hypothetical protein
LATSSATAPTSKIAEEELCMQVDEILIKFLESNAVLNE